MTEELLRTFCAVARLGSLTQAARLRQLTVSTVSSQIRTLEQELGVALFRRHARGVVLTEAGRVALGHAIRILGGYDAMRVDLEQRNGRPRRQLRVGMIQTTSRHFLAEALSGFFKTYGDVDIAVTLCNSAQCMRLFKEGMVDLAVISSAAPPPGVRAQPYFSSRMVAVGPPGTLAADQPVRVAELLESRRLMVREDGSGTRGALESALQARGVRLTEFPSVTALPDTDLIKAVVAAGAGHTILAELVVRQEVASGRLSAAPLDDLDVIQHFFILYPSRADGHPRWAAVQPIAETFVEALYASYEAVCSEGGRCR